MNQNSKVKNPLQRASILESIREIGDAADPKDIVRQIFGTPYSHSNPVSGEILPYEKIDFEDVRNGQHQEKQKLEHQLALERQLREEEVELLKRKSEEHKIVLHAIVQELKALAAQTPRLAAEIEIAVMQAPANPHIYHVFFFTNLLVYLKGFNTDIGRAIEWLHARNKRAAKMGFWAQVKKQGQKRLMNAEDYSGRSAA